MRPRRRRQREPLERCACGTTPFFVAVYEQAGMRNFFACPPVPTGCGRCGPEHVDEQGFTDQEIAAASWDAWRIKERTADDARA